MRDVFDALSNEVENYGKASGEFDPFLWFEPWDVSAPDEDVVRMAEEDGVDLFRGDVPRLAGPYPRKFQTGESPAPREPLWCKEVVKSVSLCRR